MNRPRVFVSCAVLGLALLAATPAAATEDAGIRSVDTGRFPQVAVTISVPGSTALTADGVTVTEDGEEAPVLSVAPLTETAPSVDVVLAFDLSNSMRGEPVASAVAAAKRFVQGLPQESRVGLLTFGGRPRVVVPVTPDHATVLAALAELPSTTFGTPLFDAVAQASRMFTGSGQHNIVLLANGPNTVGETDLSTAVATAAQADATVFSVGFRDGETDVQTMVRLAQGTGGTYQAAQTAHLSALYADLASRISDQYVVTYRSEAGRGDQINIAVTAAGVSMTALTLVPKGSKPGKHEPVVRDVRPLIGGSWGLSLVVVVTFLAVFLVAVLLVGTGARVRRERTAALRMKAVARPSSGGERPDPHSVQWIPQQMVQVAARMAEAGGFGASLDHQLEQAGFALRAGEFVAGTVACALGGAVLGFILFQSMIVALVSTGVGGAVPYAVLRSKLRQRARRLNEQLPEVLNIMASSLRAGHSFLQALDSVAKEIPEPARSEFNRTLAEIRLGRPLDNALNAMAGRVNSESFQWAVLAVNIQREVGGNLAEILDSVAETVRERQTLLREVKVLTTEGRLSMYILTALPILFSLYLFMVRPEYVRLLYTTRIGLVMLSTAVSLLIVGFFWFRRIVKIDV